ncbi:hypothetical protein EIK77_000351 [Talaromyces pinophilus]|nr:hypothetical protein EIK77_000351 [Talaromyces pinophilus]
MVTNNERLPVPSNAQVIIVGAGLSGLYAAFNLQQAGISCLPHAYGLVKKFGLEMIKQNITGDVMLKDHGRSKYGADLPLREKDREVFGRIRDYVQNSCQTVDVLNLAKSVATFGATSMDDLAISMGASDIVRGLVNIWTAAMLGVDSTDVSLVYFLHYCKAGGGFIQMRSDDVGGGQHLRFRGGSQALATGLLSCLKQNSVVLNAAVKRIEQHLDIGCIVTIGDGRQFRSQRVISTVPSTLLPQISFSPQLSVDKLWLISQSKMGSYAKVFLCYSEPWWRRRGLCGLSQSPNGTISLTRDVSSDNDGLYALACFVVGEKGRVWAQKSPDDRIAEVLTDVDRIYGSDIPRPVHTQEQIWNNEKFSEGAPCPVVPVSCLASLGRDNWRAEGYIHFAGTETSTTWKGYMEGALVSGDRAAREVLETFAVDWMSARAKL